MSAPYSYGLYSYGLCSYSYGLYRYGAREFIAERRSGVSVLEHVVVAAYALQVTAISAYAVQVGTAISAGTAVPAGHMQIQPQGICTRPAGTSVAAHAMQHSTAGTTMGTYFVTAVP